MKYSAFRLLPKLHNRKGFTLVEISIVVGIIAIMMGVFISVLNPARQFAKARDSSRRSDLAILAVALEQYYADHNSYPDTPAPTGNNTTQIYSCLENILVKGHVDCSNTTGGDAYMKSIPHDPKVKDGIEYCYDGDPDNDGKGQDFLLCARLETGVEDIDSPYNNNAPCALANNAQGQVDLCITNQ